MTAYQNFAVEIAAFEAGAVTSTDIAGCWRASADVYGVWERHGAYGAWKYLADRASMALAQRATALERAAWQAARAAA